MIKVILPPEIFEWSNQKFSHLKIIPELIQGLHPASKKRQYKVTASPIGWVQT